MSDKDDEVKNFNENDVNLDTINDINTDADAGTGGEEGAGEDEFIPSPMEEKALARGWKPEEDWSGDPEAWTDARNYVQHGELMDKISKQSVENKKLSKSMETFKKMQAGIEKRAIESAKEELLAAKVDAYNLGDGQAVVDIEEQIKANEIAQAAVVEDDEDTLDPQADAAAFSEYFAEEWQPANKWYATNAVMRAFSDSIGVAFYNENPGLDPSEIFEHVDKQMKENFPEEFGNQKRRKPAAVGSSQSGGQGGGRSTVNKLVANLSKVERDIGEEYVKAGYFKDIGEYAKTLSETE